MGIPSGVCGVCVCVCVSIPPSWNPGLGSHHQALWVPQASPFPLWTPVYLCVKWENISLQGGMRQSWECGGERSEGWIEE